MKPYFYILALGSFLLGSCQTDEERKIQNVAKNYAVCLYTCQFQKAEKYCTPEAIEDVKWFASNITEGDIDLLSKQEAGLTVSSISVETDDTISHVIIQLDNAIQVDSLEHSPALGMAEREITLVLRKKKWLVKKG